MIVSSDGSTEGLRKVFARTLLTDCFDTVEGNCRVVKWHDVANSMYGKAWVRDAFG